MEPKEILLELRARRGFSQEQLAEKVHVTRQAVSRWETGETVPNTETLKLLSKLFDVSINTLLGSPRQLVCQCCGMPLEDANISREPDGAFNEATASGAIPTGNLSTPAWRSCWTFWRATWPMKPGPRNRSGPTLQPSCRNWITGSRDKQGSRPRNFRGWEPCFYAARMSLCSGMEFCADLQYNDPGILFTHSGGDPV